MEAIVQAQIILCIERFSPISRFPLASIPNYAWQALIPSRCIDWPIHVYFLALSYLGAVEPSDRWEVWGIVRAGAPSHLLVQCMRFLFFLEGSNPTWQGFLGCLFLDNSRRFSVTDFACRLRIVAYSVAKGLPGGPVLDGDGSTLFFASPEFVSWSVLIPKPNSMDASTWAQKLAKIEVVMPRAIQHRSQPRIYAPALGGRT